MKFHVFHLHHTENIQPIADFTVEHSHLSFTLDILGKIRIFTTRRKSATFFFQQDVGTCHWSTIVPSSLNNNITGKWIGGGDSIPWPQLLTDIMPLDFFPLCILKIHQLKEKIAECW